MIYSNISSMGVSARPIFLDLPGYLFCQIWVIFSSRGIAKKPTLTKYLMIYLQAKYFKNSGQVHSYDVSKKICEAGNTFVI